MTNEELCRHYLKIKKVALSKVKNPWFYKLIPDSFLIRFYLQGQIDLRKNVVEKALLHVKTKHDHVIH